MDDVRDPQMAMALARYQVISPYLAMEPARGQRALLLGQLASRSWTGPDGEPFRVQPDTIRRWLRRYRAKGLDGLMDRPRPARGCQALTAEQVELVCALKREVPERSLDRLIRILEGMGLVEPGTVRRSTLHRVLQARDLSARRCRLPDADDLDRFEAAFTNDLWQSDMLVGPWLPDPCRPGKMRRAYLYAVLDDHSRLLLHGRFSFKGDLPAFELVLRRCLQKWGLCRRLYFDNALVYRSDLIRQVVATLGIHRIVFTQSGRPMGHGKIEALNRLIRSAFLAELKTAGITTLDALNEAFVAWSDQDYNRQVHSETGQTPLDRWRAGVDKVRYVDERALRQAFLWREKRTSDKAGVFSLLATRYQVGPDLANRRVEVRYDPEALDSVEVWREGRFAERARPLHVEPTRRPKPQPPDARSQPRPPDPAAAPPVANWLGHLVSRRRDSFIAPAAASPLQQRVAQDDAIVSMLAERLEPAVFDQAAVRDYLDRFGPFDPDAARAALDALLTRDARRDHHVTVYLDAIRAQAPTPDQGDEP